MASCKLLLENSDIQGGLTMCLPYRESQLFFCVGSGQNPDFSTDKLLVWDDLKKDFVGEVVFQGQIQELKIVHDWVLVVVGGELFIFNMGQ